MEAEAVPEGQLEVRSVTDALEADFEVSPLARDIDLDIECVITNTPVDSQCFLVLHLSIDHQLVRDILVADHPWFVVEPAPGGNSLNDLDPFLGGLGVRNREKCIINIGVPDQCLSSLRMLLVTVLDVGCLSQCHLAAVGTWSRPHDKPGHAEHPGLVLTLEVPHPQLHELLLLGDPDVVIHLPDVTLASDDVLPEPHERPVEVVGHVRPEVHGRVEGVSLVDQRVVENSPDWRTFGGWVEDHLVRNPVSEATFLLPSSELGLSDLSCKLVVDEIFQLGLINLSPLRVLVELPHGCVHDGSDCGEVVNEILLGDRPRVSSPPVGPGVSLGAGLVQEHVVPELLVLALLLQGHLLCAQSTAATLT